MSLTLNLSSSELADEELQALTRQLCDSIAGETDIQAEIPSGAVAKGHKGEPISLGVLALSFLSGGSAVALCEVFKAYVNRVPSLEINIEKPNGAKVTINAKNLNPKALQDLLSQADFTVR